MQDLTGSPVSPVCINEAGAKTSLPLPILSPPRRATQAKASPEPAEGIFCFAVGFSLLPRRGGPIASCGLSGRFPRMELGQDYVPSATGY